MLGVAGMFISCSTENNTMVSRAYHNLTSHYNIYFNGYESYKRGIRTTEKSIQDDYTRLLPVFPVSGDASSSSVTPEMEQAIKKASKVISLHSITAKPKRKNRELTEKEQEFYNRNEYNKWIDDAYLLMGKSQFLKEDLFLAERTCRHIIQNYADEDVKNEARIWLGRIYTAQGNYREAQKALDLVEAQRDLPGKQEKFLKAAYADFYIRQEKYDLAIPKLEEALVLSRRKKDKSRYAFILAQLNERTGNDREASRYYRRVIKLNPPYDMTFNARINLAGTFDVENRDSREITKELRKMLRDAKNKDYQDQIYYALGRVSYREGKVDDAIELYLKSARTSVSNASQKGLSYLSVADIYFARVKYQEAQMYYDSAVNFLRKDYPKYDQIYGKSRNLNQLVGFIQTVEREDSLQYVASLDENARNRFIDGLIQQVRQKEQETRQREMDQQRNNMLYYQNQSRFRDDFNEGGKWYFYNQSAMGFGQMEFKRKWGDRKLEDNWRRANKSTASFDNMGNPIQGEGGTAGPGTEGGAADNKSRDYYLADLPLTDSAMTVSNDRIKDALYGLGTAYRELFNDIPRAIEALEELNRRYPGNPHQLESYYDLYTMYNEAGNSSRANTYKQKILNEYPDSEYALILTDPDYFQRQAEKQARAEQVYQQVYALYQEGNYREVLSRSDQALKEFSNPSLVPRFSFLRAVAIGHLSGNRALKDELTALIEKYPDSDISAMAGQVIELIREENPEIRAEEEMQQAAEIYAYNPEAPHLVLLVLNPGIVNFRQLNFNIINFNIENYTNENYELNEDELDGRQRTITIGTFPDRKTCEAYLRHLVSTTDVFSGMVLPSPQPVMISVPNYRVFLNDKSFSTYLKFYEKQYIGQ